ncbi:MAG: DUF362 domain-containing protein [Bryobacteraceae bacterium]|nr:DUF362 domain-containing protein [Bryobacteraceae bacterium]
MNRRRLLQLLGAASAGRLASRSMAAGYPLGIPGLYPGRVVGVRHSSSIAGGVFQSEPIRQMMVRGMTELTGAPDWASAWRRFFSPGDVVGIKLNGVGMPRAVSSREVFTLVVDGLTSAGVRPEDIVAYDRYQSYVKGAGFASWLPAGVKLTWAVAAYDDIQQSIDGYDPAHYVDFPYVLPGQSLSDPTARRSFAATFITQQVNKLVNLAVLKDHQAAGVTLCLKNLSHGLANNVARSHVSIAAPVVDAFIPAVVSMPAIRDKTVLHILDGVKGVFHGGPGAYPEFVWEHQTMYFGTDPVAVDRIGWKQIDRQRLASGLLALTDSGVDRYGTYPTRQPEHIDLAGAAGLGVADETKIDYRMIRLG